MNRALTDYASEDLETSDQILSIKEEAAPGTCSQAKLLDLAINEYQYLTKGLENTERTLNKMAALRTLPQARRHKNLLQEKKIRVERRLSAKAIKLRDVARKAMDEAEKAMAQAKRATDEAEELETLAKEAEHEIQ